MSETVKCPHRSLSRMIGNPDTGVISYEGWVCDDCDHVMLVEEAPRVTEPEQPDLPEVEIVERENAELRARPSAAKLTREQFFGALNRYRENAEWLNARELGHRLIAELGIEVGDE